MQAQPNIKPEAKKPVFTRYQVFVIAILSIVQFSVILDFMVLSPLSDLLIKTLDINASEFSLVVSAYAISAGVSGILAAGFADKFDRKKLLIFFYSGFIVGTLMCGLAPGYTSLLIARIVTGIFGGVISSISFAIITDLFRMEVRGRVMGFVQMAFAASQVLGIPAGLYLANSFGWHSPFLMIVGFSAVVVALIVMYLKPVNEHLKLKSDRNAFQHLLKTFGRSDYQRGFLATILLATGGFMLMPFAAAFGINNLGLKQEQLPTLYLITGVFSILFGPIIGKLSDKFGKYRLFFIGSVIAMIMVTIYTNMGITPLWLVIVVNVFMFVGISSRMISSSALVSAVPDPQDRGAFMGINSSLQQFAGGIASGVAGLIVYQTPAGHFEHYPTLGYVVNGAMIVTLVMMYIIHRQVKTKMQKAPGTAPQPDVKQEVVLEESHG